MESAFYGETFGSEDWDWWHVGRRRILSRVLRRGLAGAGLGGRTLDMLDVGCGTGGTTAYLSAGHAITGCDIETAALGACRSRGVTRVVRGSAAQLPFVDASFDVALCLDVLEHHEDDLAVSRELARVVRPGGLVLATVPCFGFLWGPHDVLSHHVRRYRMPGFLALLRRAGLNVLRASYFNTLLFPAAAAVQIGRRLLRGGEPVRPASDLPQGGPGLGNALLRATFSAEAPWLARFALPVGVSAFALARAGEPS